MNNNMNNNNNCCCIKTKELFVKIDKIRNGKGLTQKQFYELNKMSKQGYHNYKNGIYSISITKLDRICNNFNMTLTDLLLDITDYRKFI